MSDEAILLKILAACERTAAATERLADIAEEGRHERKSAPAMTSESQAATCQKAFDEDRPLIVDYVISGKYQNIEDVKLGAYPTRPAAAVEDDDEIPF